VRGRKRAHRIFIPKLTHIPMPFDPTSPAPGDDPDAVLVRLQRPGEDRRAMSAEIRLARGAGLA